MLLLLFFYLSQINIVIRTECMTTTHGKAEEKKLSSIFLPRRRAITFRHLIYCCCIFVFTDRLFLSRAFDCGMWWILYAHGRKKISCMQY